MNIDLILWNGILLLTRDLFMKINIGKFNEYNNNNNNF